MAQDLFVSTRKGLFRFQRSGGKWQQTYVAFLGQPVTAFLAVASKAAGFVALMTLVFVGFRYRTDVFQPMMWVLAVLTMVVGNLIALRQTNIVRMLAYSGVAQAGYMLAPD